MKKIASRVGRPLSALQVFLAASIREQDNLNRELMRLESRLVSAEERGAVDRRISQIKMSLITLSYEMNLRCQQNMLTH